MFDAIRYSVEMAWLSYQRLEKTLFLIGSDRDAQSDEFEAAFLDAWSVVDCIHRLRSLIQKVPNTKVNAPGLKTFLADTITVIKTRNYLQHIEQERDACLRNGRPILGVISWFLTENPLVPNGRVVSIMAGTLWTGVSIPIVNPCDQNLTRIVDLVTIYLGEHSLCISHAMGAVITIARKLEAILDTLPKSCETAGSDYKVMAVFEGHKGDEQESLTGTGEPR